MKYRLKDNQIEGRYYGVDVIFDSKQEIEDTLKEALMDDDVDVSLTPLWELLEMADYEIEEMKGGEKMDRDFICKTINDACHEAWDMGHKAPKRINIIDQFSGYVKARRLVEETVDKIMLEGDK